MSTLIADRGNVIRRWYILDAAGKPLGKTAAVAAILSYGKHKSELIPRVDCGDLVMVVNTEEAVLTDKKLGQKHYHHHSDWIGGPEEIKCRLLIQQKPELAMQLVVRGMLPRNIITKDSLSHLHIYRSTKRLHTAQKSETWTVT